MEKNRGNEILEFDNISKTFPGVLALDKVSFKVRKGEVHGLVGENGAGKSTLIKILCGIYSADSGRILINGEATHITAPQHSQNYGVRVMHQEISVLPNMTVAENLMINDIPKKARIFMDSRSMKKKAKAALDMVGLDYVDPDRCISEYSLATQQMVNLARIMAMDPRVVLLDEPTASLTMNEAEQLFKVIKRLSGSGVSVIYISHYLEEVLRVCDCVTVLRDGKYVDTFRSEDTDSEKIVTAMIGKSLSVEQRKSEATGEPVLKMKNVSGISVIRHIDLELKEKEILGLYGLNGAGKTETLRAIAGIDRMLAGEMELFGKKEKNPDITGTLSKGVIYVSEDRRRQGLVLGMSVLKNASLGNEKKYAGMQFIREREEKADARKYIEKMRVKTPSEDTLIGVLSGGNQQKVILGRCMARDAGILLLDEPTVGIDVGAREEIYHLISEMVSDGASVILASSDINEILQMSDRIAVIAHGTVVKVVDRAETTQEELMLYAMGDVTDGK